MNDLLLQLATAINMSGTGYVIEQEKSKIVQFNSANGTAPETLVECDTDIMNKFMELKSLIASKDPEAGTLCIG